jgi:ribonuclease-3
LKFGGSIFERFFPKDKQLKKSLENLLGFSPGNLSIYKLALSHRSQSRNAEENNERLEFLGDAILGAIIGEHLFKKYPYKDEGYLTEMRSKIVNRQQLNEVALKIGLKKLMFYNRNEGLISNTIFGNAFEALVGAVYLDKGYDKTRRFVLKRILLPYIDIDELETTETNFKNKLYSWANKNNRILDFETIDEAKEGARKLFTIAIVVDGERISTGKAFNKKDAGQIAAKAAIEILGIE